MSIDSVLPRASRAAIALTLCLTGCSYVAEQPEVRPAKFAPASSDRPWSPPRAYTIPLEQRPMNTIPDSGAYGSFPNAAGKYDLTALINIALHNNPDTRASWDRARGAAAAYGASRAPYYPQIDTQVPAGYTRELFEIPNSVGTIKQWQVTPVVEFTYTLLDFGRRSADARAAREQLAAANFSFNRKMQEVVFATQRAFYSMGAAKAAVRAAEQNVELAKTDDEAVSRRVDLGLATQPALLLSRQRVAQSEYDLASARLLVREAQADIAGALGVAANTPIDIPSLESQPIPTGLGGEVDALIESAIRQRPDLAAQVASLNARRAQVDRSKAAFYPSVALNGGYGEQMWGYAVGATHVVKNNQPQYSAFVTLKWDLFTGFKRLNDMRQAEAERDAAGAQLESIQVGAISSVWRAYYEFQTALKRYDYAKALLAASNESYAANLDTYRQGLSTIVELLTADRDLASARYTMVQSRADLQTSSAAVAYAVGAIEMPRHP